MRWRQLGTVAVYALAFSWGVLLVLWPEAGNEVASLHDESKQATGEGLYKSSLTKANFGLLGVRFYQSSEGKKRWNIKSDFAELHRKENYAFMQVVTAEFLAGKTGNVVLTTSRYGRSLLDKQSVELEGDVTVRSKKGYLFTMDKLNYDGKSHEFTSDDVVNMRGPDIQRPKMTLRGTGLLADVDSEHFFLKKNVTAQRKLSSGDSLRITSRSGEFFTEEQRSVFISKVHSVLPKIGIDSDVLEVSLADEKESMEAHGNVVLKSRDRVGYADSAFLEVGTNRIVLEGKARVDAKDNQIRGRRILLFTDDDRIEVEEAEGKVKG